nr:immunoglobulin heavy chain junction region [Mus musculus]MBK4196014.1 immunoglobulin heavy chain junction region [Mus musculus]
CARRGYLDAMDYW